MQVVQIQLDAGDITKLDILKKRFMFSENIDAVRYLLTEAVEKIAEEIKVMDAQQNQKSQSQQQSSSSTTATTTPQQPATLARALYS